MTDDLIEYLRYRADQQAAENGPRCTDIDVEAWRNAANELERLRTDSDRLATLREHFVELHPGDWHCVAYFSGDTFDAAIDRVLADVEKERS